MSDRYVFSATAGQQIQFELLNRSSSDIVFRLTDANLDVMLSTADHIARLTKTIKNPEHLTALIDLRLATANFAGTLERLKNAGSTRRKTRQNAAPFRKG